MILGLLTQFRDNLDIVVSWLEHVDALFDNVFLIDHQSIDGTGEILKQAVEQRPAWSYYFLDSKTQFQGEVSTLIMHEAFKTGVDYLFFLDADEFVQVESRQELENLLLTRTDHSIMSDLHWKNCILQEFSNHTFDFQTPFYLPPQQSNHKKIIMPNEVYLANHKNIRISYGNYSAITSAQNKIRSLGIGNTLHFPVRSRDQIIRKAILMTIANSGFKNPVKGNNFQINEILEKISMGEFSDDDLRAFTIGYESPGLNTRALSKAELVERQYLLSTLNKEKIAQKKGLIFNAPTNHLTFEQQIANALIDLEANIPDRVRLKIENGVISIDEEAIEKTTNKMSDILSKTKMLYSMSARKIHSFVKRKF